MNCENSLLLIYDLVDGHILPNDLVLLKKHLQNCAHCQKTLNSINLAEKIYINEIMVAPATDIATSLAKKVLQNKNLFSFQPKTLLSTKKILYYFAAMASSFAAFVYLVDSVILLNLASKVDFLLMFSNIPSSNFRPDMSLGQVAETKGKVLFFLETFNFATPSTLLKDLTIILFLISLQFAISYLFTKNKRPEDKKL